MFLFSHVPLLLNSARSQCEAPCCDAYQGAFRGEPAITIASSSTDLTELGVQLHGFRLLTLGQIRGPMAWALPRYYCTCTCQRGRLEHLAEHRRQQKQRRSKESQGMIPWGGQKKWGQRDL